MIHTKEIRWFFEQENSQILNWFEAQGLNEYQVHEDIYLNLGKEDIGIKLREGRVEIKQRWAIELKEVLGKIVIHTSTDKLESGCLVEYTKLYSASHVWYTFGLEWFGKIYIQVPADFILDILGSTEVHFNQSKGYTSFLIGHIK